MSETDTELIEAPLGLITELADHHKDVARHGYKNNQTAIADVHHSLARRLNDCTEREWSEVGEQ